MGETLRQRRQEVLLNERIHVDAATLVNPIGRGALLGGVAEA